MKNKKSAYIYLILFPNGCKYVGQTRDLKDRKRRYRNHDCKSQKKLYAHLCKYTFKKCQFILLEDVLVYEELNEREAFWIKKLNTFSGTNKKFGLNLTVGGDGCPGWEWTDAHKFAASERMKGDKNPNFGKTHSPEVRRIISESKKGKPSHNKGVPMSDETKLKVSLAKKGQPCYWNGKKMPPESAIKLSETKSSLIFDTFTGIFYLGIKAAAHARGLNANTLKWYLSRNSSATKNPTSLITV